VIEDCADSSRASGVAGNHQAPRPSLTARDVRVVRQIIMVQESPGTVTSPPVTPA
jgi:hypothetical protein